MYGPTFPVTRNSVVIAARSTDGAEARQGVDRLIAAYWKPVYKYIRLRWGKPAAETQDLTQAFFARALEKDLFRAYDPAKSRFRTYLRMCVDGFVVNELKADSRLKRGGNGVLVSIDFAEAEAEFGLAAPAATNIEDYLQREWIRGVFAAAIDALRRSFATEKQVCLRLFEAYYLTETNCPNYRQLAELHDLPVTQVTNYLALARREFRRLLLEHLRDSAISADEFRRDAMMLLRADGQ